MRSKQTRRAKRTAASKKAVWTKQWHRSPVAVRAGVIAAAALAVIGAAAVVTRGSAPAAAPSRPDNDVALATADMATPPPAAPQDAAGRDDSNGGASQAPIVTLTGCLEQSDETFRLKDAAGSDAPMARSWKSAFLKRRPAPIGIVDASNRLKLRSHVGQRVTVSGPMVDREMQVRSLRRIAPSCDRTAA